MIINGKKYSASADNDQDELLILFGQKPTAKIYSVGTIHIDLKGPERLDKLLNKIKPDIIALEMSADRVPFQDKDYLKNETEKIEELLIKENIVLNSEEKSALFYIAESLSKISCFEYAVSTQYVKNNPKTRLEYIDISVYTDGKESFLNGMEQAGISQLVNILKNPILKESMKQILAHKKEYLESMSFGTDMLYNDVQGLLELVEEGRTPEGMENLKKEMPPDAFNALSKVFDTKRDEAMANRIIELYSGGKNSVVSITGLAHIPGIISRIDHLHPKVLTLNDYWKI